MEDLGAKIKLFAELTKSEERHKAVEEMANESVKEAQLLKNEISKKLEEVVQSFHTGPEFDVASKLKCKDHIVTLFDALTIEII